MMRPWFAQTLGFKRRFFASMVACLAIALPTFSTPACAGSFTEDFANCASGAIQLTTGAAEDAVKAAEFAINHGECLPPVAALDPVLISMTGGILGLQAANQLPRPAGQCKAAIFSVAQRPIAGMINVAVNQTPVLSPIFPQSARTRLQALANGSANEQLFSIPGVSVIAEKLSCGCAVAETGVPIEQLRDRSKLALETVNSCAGVITSLFNGAYSVASTTVAAVQAALSDLYGSFSDGVSAISCGLGITSCPSENKGPPFFCVGYHNLRSRNIPMSDIQQQWASIWQTQWGMMGLWGAQNSEAPPNPYDADISHCEIEYQAMIEQAERARIMAEQLTNAERFADSFALRYFIDWSPECKGDMQCRDGLAMVADQFGDDLADPETLALYPNFPATVMAMNEKYRSNARSIVAIARDRRYTALRANPTAPTIDRLPAFDCNPYLGREQQSLCKNAAGFNVCKDYVNANAWRLCYAPGPTVSPSGRAYAKGARLRTMVRNAGCIAIESSNQRVARGVSDAVASQSRNSNNAGFAAGLIAASMTGTQRYQCIGQAAYRTCQMFKDGGSDIDCGGPRSLAPLQLNAHVNAIDRPLNTVLAAGRLAPVPPVGAVRPPRVPEVRRPVAPPATTPATVPPGTRQPIRVRPTTPIAPATTVPPAPPASTVPRVRRPGG
jgi:hypothetical protein